MLATVPPEAGSQNHPSSKGTHTMTLEERVARLEQQQELATRADLRAATLELSRDIANLAAGVGGDLREILQELFTIRRLLERRAFRWPWEVR